jgi:hypothetical protein
VEFVIVLLILMAVVLIVTAPLRRVPVDASIRQAAIEERTELDELEAAQAAKYREIRDAELDHSTGKLSDLDFDEVDLELRAEAIDIMRELDRVRGSAEQLPSDEL